MCKCKFDAGCFLQHWRYATDILEIVYVSLMLVDFYNTEDMLQTYLRRECVSVELYV